jgi:hypothetical protein
MKKLFPDGDGIAYTRVSVEPLLTSYSDRSIVIQTHRMKKVKATGGAETLRRDEYEISIDLADRI